MPKVKLESLEVGMVVASEVKNMDDMLLIPAGCEITERHINILESWGITEIEVKAGGQAEETADPLSKLTTEEAARLSVDVLNRFWRFDETDPMQLEVYALILRRKARLGHTRVQP